MYLYVHVTTIIKKRGREFEKDMWQGGVCLCCLQLEQQDLGIPRNKGECGKAVSWAVTVGLVKQKKAKTIWIFYIELRGFAKGGGVSKEWAKNAMSW